MPRVKICFLVQLSVFLIGSSCCLCALFKAWFYLWFPVLFCFFFFSRRRREMHSSALIRCESDRGYCSWMWVSLFTSDVFNNSCPVSSFVSRQSSRPLVIAVHCSYKCEASRAIVWGAAFCFLWGRRSSDATWESQHHRLNGVENQLVHCKRDRKTRHERCPRSLHCFITTCHEPTSPSLTVL